MWIMAVIEDLINKTILRKSIFLKVKMLNNVKDDKIFISVKIIIIIWMEINWKYFLKYK